MELSKEQIKFIDHRLENDGINYWDIRIEMLDHVVSDVEKHLNISHNNYQFEELVQDAFVSLGWKENFNGGSLDHVFQKTLKNYGNNSRKLFVGFYKAFFKDFKNILFIGLFWLYLLFIHENSQIMKYTFFVFFFILSIGLISYMIKYNIFKSVKLNSLFSLTFLPLSFFNLFLFVPKVFLGYEKSSSIYVALLAAVIIPFVTINVFFLYKEFKSEEKKYNKLLD